MKKIQKIIPVSLYDIPGLERWLEEQAALGLFPLSLGSWAVFEERDIPGVRFRLDPFANRMGEGTEPTPEKLELYRQSGWEYAFSIGRTYFLFYNTGPDAPELYTDYQSQGMSLERLTKRLRSYRWQWIAVYSIIVLLFLAVLFHPFQPDVQPAPLARLPLILLYLFHPSPLFFLVAACFSEPIHQRNRRTLTATYNALKEGLPPPSPGPSRQIVRENIATLALIPVILAVALFNFTGRTGSYSLSECPDPYISLTELETVNVFAHMPELRTEDNEATRQFSLISPVWYEVKQKFLSWEDVDGGYSPSLDMTCFHLLFPALARPIATAQLDAYRLVNLEWSYEEVPFPDTDFIVLAKTSGHPFQMAAVCSGGRLAVFRYNGMEDLGSHLEQLAEMVQ